MPKTDDASPAGRVQEITSLLAESLERLLPVRVQGDWTGAAIMTVQPPIENYEAARKALVMYEALRAAHSHPADAPAPQVEPAPSLDKVRREARRQAFEEAAKIAEADTGMWSPTDRTGNMAYGISVPPRIAKAIRAAAAADPVRGEGGER